MGLYFIHLTGAFLYFLSSLLKFYKHKQADAAFNRAQLRKNGELLLTHANYVECKSFFFLQCQFIAYVAACASSEINTITTEEQTKLFHNIAFALHAIILLEVDPSHSMGYLFPRNFLIKRKMMKYLKKR